MVEGGGFTLQQFISSNVWDEIRLFTGQHHLVNGMPSPDLDLIPSKSIQVGVDQLDYYYAAT
jgi:diaminohydroxyphosphoribosylaminopyrimidine deaminase/5-amino-6-(5-phosphoribosylamino)uracil reductase